MAEAPSVDAPLTLTDHRLAWALVAVVNRLHMAGTPREAMFRDELARAVRLSDSRNTHVRRLHDCATRLLAAAPRSGDAIWAHAQASQALCAFAEWRLACAMAKEDGEVAA